MAEKVVIGNAELWHGDCREVLPLLELAQEVLSVAAHGCLLDGDEVNTPTLLWAEEWHRKISGPNVRANLDPTA